MIERYTRQAIGKIWSDENKFNIWLKIELAAVYARYKLGEVPDAVYNEIRKKAFFDTKKILEIEETVKHDVIAFLTNVAEYTGEIGKILHYGMTSSDVLDTCLAIQLKQSAKIILKGLTDLNEAIKIKALETKNLLCIGRTHGVHAELTTYGLKFALWYDENNRNIHRLKKATETISVGKFSGAVGTYEHLNPKVEEIACRKLGLKPSNISTQIIQRDIHAEFLSTLALIATSLEKFATEIRHLQKTETLEVEEPFTKGQKGSSAMPHKKNPIICERVAGLARILRANCIVGFENMVLWHERDISHSSSERIIFPDSTIALDYMIDKMLFVITNLKINKKNIANNINRTNGLIYSQKLLLKLIEKGLIREQAYSIVQSMALKSWDKNLDLKKLVINNKLVKRYLGIKEIEIIFKEGNLLKNVDLIFKKTKVE